MTEDKVLEMVSKAQEFEQIKVNVTRNEQSKKY